MRCRFRRPGSGARALRSSDLDLLRLEEQVTATREHDVAPRIVINRHAEVNAVFVVHVDPLDRRKSAVEERIVRVAILTQSQHYLSTAHEPPFVDRHLLLAEEV